MLTVLWVRNCIECSENGSWLLLLWDLICYNWGLHGWRQISQIAHLSGASVLPVSLTPFLGCFPPWQSWDEMFKKPSHSHAWSVSTCLSVCLCLPVYLPPYSYVGFLTAWGPQGRGLLTRWLASPRASMSRDLGINYSVLMVSLGNNRDTSIASDRSKASCSVRPNSGKLGYRKDWILEVMGGHIWRLLPQR